METERFRRQLDIVPFNRVSKESVSLIGCGAIGRQLALQLAAIGVNTIQLIDFDTVVDHNRTTQGYRINDIGEYKVEALEKAIQELYDDVNVEVCNGRYPDKQIKLKENIFLAVDSIRARKQIWEVIRNIDFNFMCDARMLAENMHVYTVNRQDQSKQDYEKTLFNEDVEQKGSCTGRMTIYSAGVCAGLVTHQFTRYLRDMPTSSAKNFNMLGQLYTNIKEGFSAKKAKT